MKYTSFVLVGLIVVPLLLVAVPQAATLYVDWKLDTTESGEFITAFAHLYGVPQVEENFNLYFCGVELDATNAKVPTSGIMEISVGEYAQPAREVYEIAQKNVYTYGLNPTFNEKIAQISTPTPVTVDLKITDKSGAQLYADSKTIQMLPIGYYAWILGDTDMRPMSPVLATPHADPVQKVIGTAAKATPWKAILGYQEYTGYSHDEIVEYQMQAIYNVLQNLDISYVSTMATFTSTDAQRVRLPVQTLADRGGNCIELTLLFDAAYEAMGFNTEFVFVPGHVFIAVETWPGSGEVFPLETTMLGTNPYTEARSRGIDEYNAASDGDSYIFRVGQVRQIGVAPTPYMDKMSDGTVFYEKIDQISTQIGSARTQLERLKNSMESAESVPHSVEEQYNKAISLFEIGKYEDSEKLATEGLDAMGQGEITTTETGTAETFAGFVFLLLPVVVIVLAVLYLRARRKGRATPATAAVVTAPTVVVTAPAAVPSAKFCIQCGKDIPLDAEFCKHCGIRQV